MVYFPLCINWVRNVKRFCLLVWQGHYHHKKLCMHYIYWCEVSCPTNVLNGLLVFRIYIRKTYIDGSPKPEKVQILKMRAFSVKCTHFHLICIKCVHFHWKCAHFHLICIKCTHFPENARKCAHFHERPLPVRVIVSFYFCRICWQVAGPLQSATRSKLLKAHTVTCVLLDAYNILFWWFVYLKDFTSRF